MLKFFFGVFYFMVVIDYRGDDFTLPLSSLVILLLKGIVFAPLIRAHLCSGKKLALISSHS
jgi:hypothetical protein